MNTKISKAIPNKFIISLDPSGQYVLNESGGKQYLYNLLTMENEILMRKKVQNVLWQKEWMFILTESTVTHRLNLSTHETYKYKRYNCDIFTSEFVETDTYIIRYDSFTHNIQICDKESYEAKVVVVQLRQSQRIKKLVHMAHDVCLVLIINDDAEHISSKFEFVFLNIKNMSLTKVEVHDRVKNDMMNMFFLTDILYIRNMNIWFIQIRDRILLLNDDLQEILYDLNGYNFDFEIVYVYDELDSKKFVLFEVKYDDKYYIMKLNLINNKCSSLYELEYYSPFLYSCSLNKLIIGNSYNQRGGFDIVDMEII